VIEVRDAAPAFPDVLPRVFEPFVQADRSLERSRGGLGIGLTLVKKIVELHHGQVSVRAAGSARAARSRFGCRRCAAGRGAAPPRRAAAHVAFPARVLVVDDNVDAAESLAMLLQSDGTR
jgi:signal transduction histidine kinase